MPSPRTVAAAKAAKAEKQSRLSRFKEWSPEHQARVLQDAGVNEQQFAGMTTGQRRAVVDRGLSEGKRLNSTSYLTAPMTGRQALAEADRVAGLQYDPAIRANQQLGQSVPSWYANYMAQNAAQQSAARAYAAPVVDQAQQGVANAGALTPGLDPNSAQYATDQQAAKGRESIAQLGASSLAAIPVATDAYFGGLSTTAARELPQVQAQITREGAALMADRGRAATVALGEIRGNQQNYQIANRTLGLNQDKANADTMLASGINPVTGQPLPVDAPTGYEAGGPKQNSYGYTFDEWNALTPAQRDKARAGKGSGSGGLTESQKRAAREKEAKRVEGVRRSTADFQTRIADAVGQWKSSSKKQVQNGVKVEDDPTGEKGDKREVPTYRPVTTDEVRDMMREAGYNAEEVHIALLRRVGKPLDARAISYMRKKNLRIPREWLPQKLKLTRPGNAPSGPGSSESRPT